MDKEEIIKIFQTINNNVRCPRCGKKYRFENIKIINSSDSFCFVKLYCQNHLPIIASIAVYRDKNKTAKNISAITNDDLIVLYEKIKKIKSVSELFCRKSL